MRRFIFTEEVLQALAKERYHHPDPRVQERMEIVWLKSKGETHERIAELSGVSRRTVQRVLDVFAKEGLDGLRKFRWHGQASALTPHRESLEAEFCERPPHTVSEACQRIEELTGVRRKPTQVRKFLRETLHLSWRKVAAGSSVILQSPAINSFCWVRIRGFISIRVASFLMKQV